MENPGIDPGTDPGTSRMQSKHSTIWANPPYIRLKVHYGSKSSFAISKDKMENLGIDPSTSRMLSERSTIWANPPYVRLKVR